MRKRRASKTFVGVALLTATVAFFHFVPDAAKPLRNAGDLLTLPIFRAVGQDENGTTVLTERDARIHELEEENAALRRLASVNGSISRPRTLTRVFWYDPDPSRRALRIAVPDGATFASGEAVIAPNGALVGRIEGVFRRSADVLLVDDPAFRFGVTIGETLEGVASGNGRGELFIDLVPAERAPEMGTAVRSSGKDGKVPAGIFVGWIAADSEASPSGGIAALRVAPAADLPSLEAVAVIASGSPLSER